MPTAMKLYLERVFGWHRRFVLGRVRRWSSQGFRKRHSPAAFRTCRNAGNSVLTAEGTTSKGTGSISCGVAFCIFYRLSLRTLRTKDVLIASHCNNGHTLLLATVTMVTRSHPHCDVICTFPVLCTFICCHCCIRLWMTEEFEGNLSHIRPTLCTNRKLFQRLVVVCRVAANWCCKTNKSESYTFFYVRMTVHH
jgi:hypothetical protein